MLFRIVDAQLNFENERMNKCCTSVYKINLLYKNSLYFCCDAIILLTIKERSHLVTKERKIMLSMTKNVTAIILDVDDTT